LPEWITTEEAARQSGYHPEYVRRLARQGKIGAAKKGRDWWVDREVFRAYLEAMNALGNRRHNPTAPWKNQPEDKTEGLEG
jgi:excisionase family DNA binding protein